MVVGVPLIFFAIKLVKLIPEGMEDGIFDFEFWDLGTVYGRQCRSGQTGCRRFWESDAGFLMQDFFSLDLAGQRKNL